MNVQGAITRDPYAVDNEIELIPSNNYTCECDDGYYLAVHPTTGYQYCADVDDCALDTDGDGRDGPCGHPDNQCIDDFRNHTCHCALGYKLILNETTNRPTCIDVDECAQFGQSICGSNRRDGMVAVSEHQCVNHEGGYSCSCAPGYRDNQLICAMVSIVNNTISIPNTGDGSSTHPPLYELAGEQNYYSNPNFPQAQNYPAGHPNSRSSNSSASLSQALLTIATDYNTHPSTNNQIRDALDQLKHSTAPGNFFSNGLPPVILIQDMDGQPWNHGVASDMLEYPEPHLTDKDHLLFENIYKNQPHPKEPAVFIHPLMAQIFSLSVGS